MSLALSQWETDVLRRTRHAADRRMLLATDEVHFLLCKPLIGNLVQSGGLLLPEPGFSHAERSVPCD